MHTLYYYTCICITYVYKMGLVKLYRKKRFIESQLQMLHLKRELLLKITTPGKQTGSFLSVSEQTVSLSYFFQVPREYCCLVSV